MSTNSFIGIENPLTKEIKGIYCHWDGYPSSVGQTLKDHYVDEEKIKELISLGEISNLGPKIGPSEVIKEFGFSFYQEDEYFKKYDTEEKRRQASELSEEFTTAYHRDRDEDLFIQTYCDMNAFIRENEESSYEYAYLFINNKWNAYELIRQYNEPTIIKKIDNF